MKVMGDIRKETQTFTRNGAGQIRAGQQNSA